MYKVECVDSIKGKKITDYKIIAIYNEKIVILKRNRMGVIDIDGNELIPAIYSEIIDCINDCFIVRFKNSDCKMLELGWVDRHCHHTSCSSN